MAYWSVWMDTRGTIQATENIFCTSPDWLARSRTSGPTVSRSSSCSRQELSCHCPRPFSSLPQCVKRQWQNQLVRGTNSACCRFRFARNERATICSKSSGIFPYTTLGGLRFGIGRISGPGQMNTLASVVTIHDATSSNLRRRLIAGGKATASDGFAGGVCVTARTRTSVWPSSRRTDNARTTAGRSFRASSRPLLCSSAQR